MVDILISAFFQIFLIKFFVFPALDLRSVAVLQLHRYELLQGRHQLCWSGQLHYRIPHQKDHQGADHHLQVRLYHRAPEADLRTVHRLHPELQDRLRQPVPHRVLHPLHSGRLCGYRRAVEGCVQRGRSAEHRGARCHLWSVRKS